MFTKSDERENVAFFRRRQPPRIMFKPEVIYAQQFVVDMCKEEVGWVGTVSKIDDNTYLIDEIFVPTQGVKGAECEILGSGYAEIEREMIARGTIDKMFELKFWGHSHVVMSVSPSSTDQTSAREKVENAGDFFIRAICNKKGHMHVSFFDGREGVAYENVDWEIYDGIDKKAIYDKMAEVVKRNVLPHDVAFPKPVVEKKESAKTEKDDIGRVGSPSDLRHLTDEARATIVSILGDNWQPQHRKNTVRRKSQGAPATA